MEADSPQYGVVLITTASQEEGETIARALLSEQLAACVNIFPVNSLYNWQGELNCDREYQLIIKTNLAYFDILASKIKMLHSYEVPEIIALPIVVGSSDYLNWLGSNLKSASTLD